MYIDGKITSTDQQPRWQEHLTANVIEVTSECVVNVLGYIKKKQKVGSAASGIRDGGCGLVRRRILH